MTSDSIKEGDGNPAARCVIYTRFSPRPDATESDSAETQEAICRRFAAERGWTIAGVFSDAAVSGSTDFTAREGLTAAVDSLKKGDRLLVLKRDRLARDLLIGLQIERVVEKRKAAIICVQGEPFGSDPNAVLMKQILMVVAEWERKMIADRTRSAMREKSRRGIYMGGLLPYGYMHDPANAGKIIENPAEMPTLCLIRDLRKEGNSFKRIAEKLDPATARNGKWHPEVVRHIVKRLAYCPAPD